MGKTAQLLIAVIVFAISFNCQAQCTDSIKVIKDNGCKRYSISEGLMVDLFVAKRSLDTVHSYIAIIQTKLDSTAINNVRIEANNTELKKTIANQRKEQVEKDSLCAHTVMRHKQVLSDVVKETESINLRLSKEINNRWKWFAGGGFLVLGVEALAYFAFK